MIFDEAIAVVETKPLIDRAKSYSCALSTERDVFAVKKSPSVVNVVLRLSVNCFDKSTKAVCTDGLFPSMLIRRRSACRIASLSEDMRASLRAFTKSPFSLILISTVPLASIKSAIAVVDTESPNAMQAANFFNLNMLVVLINIYDWLVKLLLNNNYCIASSDDSAA